MAYQDIYTANYEDAAPTAGATTGAGTITGAGAGGRRAALTGTGTVTGTGSFVVVAYARTGTVSGSGMAAGAAVPRPFRTVGLGGTGKVAAAGLPEYAQFVYRAPVIPDLSRPVEWRYLAQNLVTGEWLHDSLPWKRDSLTWDLSGPGNLRATISPEVAGTQLRDDTGQSILQPWQTAIYAEANGAIRWGGIVVRTSTAGAQLSVECAGFTTYPRGLPYTGPLYQKINMDPITAFRDIWNHLQAQPDGDLGVELVLPNDCPVRLGVPGVPGYTTYKAKDGKFYAREDMPAGSPILVNATAETSSLVKADSTIITLAKLDRFAQVPIGSMLTIGDTQREKVQLVARSGLRLNVKRGQDGTDPASYFGRPTVRFEGATETDKVDAIPAEPYTLAWWEAPDCGQELDQLAAETPFDYTEEHFWQADGTVGHRVRVDYPRLGRKRTDLAFVLGENVQGVVEVTKDGDGYANAVVGLGIGEGTKTLRSETAKRDGRLRRAVVYTDKMTRTRSRLQALVNGELSARDLDLELSSVTVRDHVNARIGSWTVGDDILVCADLPWVGYVELWNRITSWSLVSDTQATLTLAPSESFTYGRPSSVTS